MTENMAVVPRQTMEMIPLRDYVDTHRIALERRVDDRIDLMQQEINARFHAHTSAEQRSADLLEKRLSIMNEFRSQLQFQAGTFITRREHDALMARLSALEGMAVTRLEYDALVTRIGNIENRAANVEGRLWAVGVGATILTTTISTIIGVALHLIR